MKEHKGKLEGRGLRFALAASRYNDFVTSRLVEGAVACLREHGVAEDDIELFWCPGALEIPALASRLAAQGAHARFFDGLVCIGCVIRGGTDHYTHVSTEAVRGVAQVGVMHQIAVGNAVLTVEDAQQALERSGEKTMNKGWEAALAALEMAGLFRGLK